METNTPDWEDITKAPEPREVSRIEATAYHEAGHLVMCHLVGVSIVNVSITENDSSYGRTRHMGFMEPFDPELIEAPRTNLESRKKIEDVMLICFAGHIAEHLLTGRNNWKGSEEDRSKATKLASYITSSKKETSTYRAWLWERATNMIRRRAHWELVEALARRLLEKNDLTYAEVMEVLEAPKQKWSMGLSDEVLRNIEEIERRDLSPECQEMLEKGFGDLAE